MPSTYQWLNKCLLPYIEATVLTVVVREKINLKYNLHPHEMSLRKRGKKMTKNTKIIFKGYFNMSKLLLESFIHSEPSRSLH